MQGTSIEIRDLEKTYGKMVAVNNVNLNVDQGEFIGLLGPSGSGKTTLLMSIAGFVEPTSGSIRIGNVDVTHTAPRERNIGMVFQKYALFPHMTVSQNIIFPLQQKNMAKADIAARLEWITELVGLTGLRDRQIPFLSGGQQQRVALARALVFKPPLLLMDEPLGALDKKLRERLQDEIKRIQKVTGTTVIFVTHDQSEALAMADRLVVFNQGRIEQIGSPDDLYERPQTAFVADFLGETNKIAGNFVGIDEAGPVIKLDDGSIVRGSVIGDTPEIDSRIELIVRPHCVAISSQDTGSKLCGIVSSSSYLGETISLQIQLSGGQIITAKVPPETDWRVGQQFFVSWKHVDAKLFKKK